MMAKLIRRSGENVSIRQREIIKEQSTRILVKIGRALSAEVTRTTTRTHKDPEECPHTGDSEQ